MLQAAVECWLWLISTRPDLNVHLLGNIINMWQRSQDLHQGIFTQNDEEGDPLAVSEKDQIISRSPLVTPHLLWIKVKSSSSSSSSHISSSSFSNVLMQSNTVVKMRLVSLSSFFISSLTSRNQVMGFIHQGLNLIHPDVDDFISDLQTCSSSWC